MDENLPFPFLEEDSDLRRAGASQRLGFSPYRDDLGPEDLRARFKERVEQWGAEVAVWAFVIVSGPFPNTIVAERLFVRRNAESAHRLNWDSVRRVCRKWEVRAGTEPDVVHRIQNGLEEAGLNEWSGGTPFVGGEAVMRPREVLAYASGHVTHFWFEPCETAEAWFRERQADGMYDLLHAMIFDTDRPTPQH